MSTFTANATQLKFVRSAGSSSWENGRGAYLCRSVECFRRAVSSKGLERSFKQEIPQEVYDRLEKEMGEIEAEG